MVSGAAMGAATGAVSHRVSTGSWSGAGTAALNGMSDGALSGAVTGAITGAAGSAIKVSQAAKAWDSGTFNTNYHSGPPGFAEKPVCTETPLCEGCPFPSHGFLCQGGDGECMRTRLMKLSDREEKSK